MISQQLQDISTAFSKQSSSFDAIEDQNEILQWMRKRVHQHCMGFYKAGERILELNCGTGIDAVFFAEQGLRVHATDFSDGMLNELRKKIEKKNLQDKITLEKCSFTKLEQLKEQNFDHIFSNFGGLNCVKEIDKVIIQLKKFLRPGGTVTLVIMPPICPWEISLALKGNFKTAFRRFKKEGVDSNIEGIHFTTYYFNPSAIINKFGKDFKKVSLKGLATLVPPPYLENFPKRFPRLSKQLCTWEETVSQVFPFNHFSDHFILTMKKK